MFSYKIYRHRIHENLNCSSFELEEFSDKIFKHRGSCFLIIDDADYADFGKSGFLALYRQMWDIIRKQYNQLLGAFSFMDNFSKY